MFLNMFLDNREDWYWVGGEDGEEGDDEPARVAPAGVPNCSLGHYHIPVFTWK